MACDNIERSNSGYYDTIFTVKQYMGPDPSLDPNLEEIIQLYVRDSPRIGMPRSMPQCLIDIETYLRTFGIEVPRFNAGKPGNY